MKLFKRVDKTLAKHDAMEADIRRRDGVPEPIPPGSLIATRTGNVAHIKSGKDGEPGAMCEEMRLWTGWRLVRSGEVLRACHRCRLAARELTGISGEDGAA